MKVNIIVEDKKASPLSIPFGEIEKGLVYKISTGGVLLKTDKDAAQILKGEQGCDYFEVALGYKSYPAVEILGKLKAVVVEPIKE